MDFGICSKHKQRQVIGYLVITFGFILGLALMIAMAGNGAAWGIILGLVMMFGSIIAGAIMAQTTKPKRIDNFQVWLKAGAPFVESLALHPPQTHGFGQPMQGYGPQQGYGGYGPQQGYGPPQQGQGWAGYQGGWGGPPR